MLDAAFAVHTELGPGLLECTSVACLKYGLKKRGLQIRKQVSVPVVYDGQKLVDVGYRMVLLLSRELMLEVKSLEAIAPVTELSCCPI